VSGRVAPAARTAHRAPSPSRRSAAGTGRVDDKQEGETKLIAIEVNAFEAISERREVVLRVDGTGARAGLIRELARAREFPGETPVVVSLTMSEGREDARLRAGLPGQAGAGLLRRGEVTLGEAAVA
jgi:hypothetical protein